MEISTEIAEKILKGVFLEPTPKRIKTIQNVAKDDDSGTMSIATDICDSLQIERRGNRQFIYELLEMTIN